MSAKDIKYLKVAIGLALKREKDRMKNYDLSCLMLRSDGSFSFSRNSKVRIPEPSLHAEAKVLRKGGINSILWVARVTKGGNWGMARPCENCQKLIRKLKVKRVVYTIANGELGVWYP